jgi:hypothetical protein
MKTDITKLPSCELYARLLQIASFKFNISVDQCRNKYGLFTVQQWNDLLDCEL